jgi:hypothetical protein
MLAFNIDQLPLTTRRNLIPNPSIEVNAATWYGDFATNEVRSDEQAKYGNYSYKVTSLSTVQEKYVSSDYIAVEREGTYSFSVYARPSATTSISVGMAWYRIAEDTTFISLEDAEAVSCTSGEWTRVTGTFTAPVNAGFGVVYLDVTALVLNEYVYLDGFLLEQSATVGDYFDGTYLPSYSAPIEEVASVWDGTSNNSSSTLTYRTRIAFESLQQLDFTTGRKTLVDVTPAGTCTFQVINPSTVPELGTLVEVYYDTYFVWTGRIANTEKVYGIVDGTDILKVDCEGPLAIAGRAEATITEQTAANVVTLAVDACESVGLVAGSSPTTELTASHNAYQGNLLTYLQRLQNTVYGRLKESRDSLYLVAKDVVPYPQRGGGFTDSPTGNDETIYSDLRFAAKVDTYYDNVRVEPEVASAGTDGDGIQTLVVSTYSPTQSEAEALAKHIVNLYSSSTLGPSEISIITNGQSNDYWAQILDLNAAVGEPASAGGPVFQRQQVTFREQSYTMLVEGAQLSATPDRCRVTYYLSSADFVYLILDDPQYGLLNYFRLG